LQVLSYYQVLQTSIPGVTNWCHKAPICNNTTSVSAAPSVDFHHRQSDILVIGGCETTCDVQPLHLFLFGLFCYIISLASAHVLRSPSGDWRVGYAMHMASLSLIVCLQGKYTSMFVIACAASLDLHYQLRK